jgi:hypothetical protein
VNKGLIGLIGFVFLIIIMGITFSSVYTSVSNIQQEEPVIDQDQKFTITPITILTNDKFDIESKWNYGSERLIIQGRSNYMNIIDINQTDVLGRSLWVGQGADLFPAVGSTTDTVTFDKMPQKMTLSLSVINKNIAIDTDELRKKHHVYELTSDFGKELTMITFDPREYPNFSIKVPVIYTNDCLMKATDPDAYFICDVLQTTRDVLGEDDLSFIHNPLDQIQSDLEQKFNDNMSWTDSIIVQTNHEQINDEISWTDSITVYTEHTRFNDNMSWTDSIIVYKNNRINDELSWTDSISKTITKIKK